MCIGVSFSFSGLTMGVSSSAELAFGWFGKCDWVDLAALNVLSHGPVVSARAHLHSTHTNTLSY
jgi:hypothetical protein